MMTLDDAWVALRDSWSDVAEYSLALNAYEDDLDAQGGTSYDYALAIQMEAVYRFAVGKLREILKLVKDAEAAGATGIDELHPDDEEKIRAISRGLKSATDILLYQIPQPGLPTREDARRQIDRTIKKYGPPLLPPPPKPVPGYVLPPVLHRTPGPNGRWIVGPPARPPVTAINEPGDGGKTRVASTTYARGITNNLGGGGSGPLAINFDIDDGRVSPQAEFRVAIAKRDHGAEFAFGGPGGGSLVAKLRHGGGGHSGMFALSENNEGLFTHKQRGPRGVNVVAANGGGSGGSGGTAGSGKRNAPGPNPAPGRGTSDNKSSASDSRVTGSEGRGIRAETTPSSPTSSPEVGAIGGGTTATASPTPAPNPPEDRGTGGGGSGSTSGGGGSGSTSGGGGGSGSTSGGGAGSGSTATGSVVLGVGVAPGSLVGIFFRGRHLFVATSFAPFALGGRRLGSLRWRLAAARAHINSAIDWSQHATAPVVGPRSTIGLAPKN